MMQQPFLPNACKKLCNIFIMAALLTLTFTFTVYAADYSIPRDTSNEIVCADNEPAISSVSPESITLSAGSQLRFVRIIGQGTGFHFPESVVSFSNPDISVLFSFPVSSDRIWALLQIGTSAQAGFCDVTVTTGDEVAVGAGLFELKEPGGEPTKKWTGDEKISVRKEGTEGAEVALKGLPIAEYDGKECVRLSDIVKKSAVTATPEKYFYNFIAADGFSMAGKLIQRGLTSGLPPWDDMQRGYIYDAGTAGLSIVWEKNTVASESGAGLYNVRLMQGGVIELLDYNVP